MIGRRTSPIQLVTDPNNRLTMAGKYRVTIKEVWRIVRACKVIRFRSVCVGFQSVEWVAICLKKYSYYNFLISPYFTITELN